VIVEPIGIVPVVINDSLAALEYPSYDAFAVAVAPPVVPLTDGADAIENVAGDGYVVLNTSVAVTLPSAESP